MKNKMIGERLVQLREDAKYSVQEIARYFDSDVEMIQMWERGESQPNAEQMLVLSFLYGMDVDDILAGIKPEELVPDEYQEKYQHEAWLNRVGKSNCIR